MGEKKYDNDVIKNRSWFTSLIGIGANNKASSKTVNDKDLKLKLTSLKGIKEDANNHGKKSAMINMIPGGFIVNAGMELEKSKRQGDLTYENVWEKGAHAINPRLASREFANDALNQKVGNMMNEARDIDHILDNNEEFAKAFPEFSKLTDTELNQKLNSARKLYKEDIESDIDTIQESRQKNLKDISDNSSDFVKKRIAEDKATRPHETRVIDGKYRYEVEGTDPNGEIYKGAQGEGVVVSKLNDTDRKFLSEDMQAGADENYKIIKKNFDQGKESQNFDFDENGNATNLKVLDSEGNKLWDVDEEGISFEDYGPGKKNVANLGAKEATTGAGLALNAIALWLKEWWPMIVGIIILIIALVWFIYDDKNKSKKKQRTSTRKKKTSKKKKFKNQTINNIVKKQLVDAGIMKKEQTFNKLEKKTKIDQVAKVKDIVSSEILPSQDKELVEEKKDGKK